MRTLMLTLLCAFIITSINAQSWKTVFYDDFNRADGALGSNYTTNPSGGITQFGILSNEVKVASGATAPAYWILSYNSGITYDGVRVSCKFRAPNLGYGFSIAARDDGTNSYRAGVMSNSDTIAIYRSDYIGNSTKLAGEKANLDINKTYFLEFTLKNADLTFRFVEVGRSDTITINAIDNSLTGSKVNLSSYYYASNLSVFIDDFKIESYGNLTSIVNIKKNSYSIYPNPASDILTVNTNNTDLTLNIYNVTGTLVKSEMHKQNNSQINVSDLSNGIYMVEIKSKELYGKQKLIIQR